MKTKTKMLRWLRLGCLLAGAMSAVHASSPDQSKMLKAKNCLAQRADETLARLQSVREKLGLGAQHTFRLQSGQVDTLGQTHFRYRQHFDGLPIWGGEITVHLDEYGEELPATDALFRQVSLSTSPTLPEAEILARVQAWMAPKGTFERPPRVELLILPERNATIQRTRIPGLHPNAIDVVESVKCYRLTYHVKASLANALDGVVCAEFLVDAQTGDLIRRWSGLKTDQSTVNRGRSRFNGEVALSAAFVGGRYELRDPRRGVGGTFGSNCITDMGVSYNGNGTPYSDSDGMWGDGANYRFGIPTYEENGQTAAVDAAYGIQASWDYFSKIHGRNGIDGKGTSTYARVHYGLAYNNAFWDDENFCMTIGDGAFDGAAYPGFAALDIVAHEFAHGVCSSMAGLVYMGESGGLNEANSDIFGTMVEFHARNGSGSIIGEAGGNWTIGELIQEGGFRSLVKPSKDGLSADAWYPDLGNLDVHFSSGPMNRAFYFLCEGASADSSSDSFSSYLPGGMQGIGKDRAVQVWYRAMEAYLGYSSGYREARQACLRASADLFGVGSSEFRAVQNAFAAINVGLPSGGTEDLNPPTVLATVEGASGQILLKAQASDSLALSGVTFFVDGIGMGTATNVPYELAINSTTLRNGSHTLIARALDAAGNWGESAAVPFLVSNAVSECLLDPSFEGGGVGWRFTPGAVIRGFPAYAKRGNALAYLGGLGLKHSQFLEQDVDLPSGVAGLTLRFWIQVWAQADLRYIPLDTLVLKVVDPTSGALLQTLSTYSNCTGSLGYESQRFDLSAYAGQKVRLRFEAEEDEDVSTAFALDEFSLTAVTVDQAPPVVSISSGIKEGVLRCHAEADDDTGLDRVEFLLDGILVGTVSRPPFWVEIDSKTLNDGTHSLMARAWDKAGHFTAATSTVSIDNTAPQVTPVIVWSGSTQATFQALVRDANVITEVEFFVDSQPVGFLRSAPWECQVQISSLDAGSHTLQVIARDEAGNTGTGVRAFNLDHTDQDAPTVYLWSDLRPTDLTIRADGSDNVEVVRMEIFLDGVLRKSANTSFIYDANFTLAADGFGPHIVLVKAFDKAGNVGTATYSFSFDVTAPVVVVGVTGNSGPITLAGSATDASGIKSLEFLLDGKSIRNEYASSLMFTTDSGYIANGEHVLEVRATDKVGNVGSGTQRFNTFNLDKTSPFISLRLDRVDGKLRAMAVIQDTNGGARVDYVVDGKPAGTSLEAPNFLLLVDVLALGPADHTIQATAFDPYGNSGMSTTYTFSGDAVPPTIRGWIEEDHSGPVDQILFNAEASDDRSVQGVSFQIDDGYPSVVELPPYSLRVGKDYLSEGTRRLRIKAWDSAGNTTSSELDFSVVHRDRYAPGIKNVWPHPLGEEKVKLWLGIFDGTGVVGAAVYLDGTFLGNPVPDAEEPSGVFTHSMMIDTTGLAEGLHAITVLAWDAAGNTSESAERWSLIVDRHPPTGVQVFHSASNGRNWFWALAHDFTPIEMEYFVDGVSVGTPPKYDLFQGGLTFRFQLGSPEWLAYGPHTVVARANDMMGNHTDSDPLTFNIIPTHGAQVTVPAYAPQGATGLRATAPPPPIGVRYRWRVTNGSLRSPSDQPEITFDAGVGPYVLVDLETIYPGDVICTSGGFVRLTPLNLDLDRDGGNPDPVDLAPFVGALGTINGDSRYSSTLDLNSDGRIDDRDLELFLVLLGR